MMVKMKYTQTDRRIVPTIGTERYHLAKYLAKNVSPLGQSTYTINTIISTFDVMGKIKNKQVALGFNVLSTDVKSFFTPVPLTEAISITLGRDYNRKKYQLSYQITK